MKKSLSLTACVLLSSAVLLPTALSPVRAQVIAPVAARPAASLSEAEIRALGQGVAFPYELLDKVLRENVNKEGAIFYAKLKGNNDLETFVRAVAIADLNRFPAWKLPADKNNPKAAETLDRTPELMFWINAYNALFIKAIADAYPVKSPTQIKDLDTAKTRVVGGKSYSFAQMRRIIAEMDPRALFALLDGTNSGPRAQSSVFRYVGLGAQLNAVISAFVNDQTRVGPPQRLQNTVAVSPWLLSVDEYFKPKGTRRKLDGIRRILGSYTARDSDQRYFNAGDYQVQAMPANLSLNEQFVR